MHATESIDAPLHGRKIRATHDTAEHMHTKRSRGRTEGLHAEIHVECDVYAQESEGAGGGARRQGGSIA
jgi:hypothetical protein